MLGAPLQVQRLDMGHWLRFSQTGQVGYCCAGSHVHEHAISGQRTLAAIAQGDVNGARCDECAVSEDQFTSGCMIFVQMNLDNTLDHFLLSRIHSGHVDRDRKKWSRVLSRFIWTNIM